MMDKYLSKIGVEILWNKIKQQFTRKLDGLNGQILTQNNNEITSENPIQLLNLVNTQDELNNALSSVPLTLQDVFNNWHRFAHSTDTVQNNTTADGVQGALNAWYYNSSLNAIGNTVNTTPYVGFVSDKTYKNWYMKTKGIGTDNDDDLMSIIVAFMTDSNGYEHSLSVIRCGAVGSDSLTGTDGVRYSFALVLDYNDARWHNAKVLAGIASSQLNYSQWSKGSHISVRRNGNTIIAKTSQFGSDNLNIEFTYTVTSQGSLSAADYTNIRLMLNNKSKIGFGMHSQAGYFILEETEGIFDNTDIYDVLNNKIYTYDNGWVQNGTVSSKVLNLSRIYNEKTDKLFYYKDEEVYQLNTSSSEIDLSDYVTKSELSGKANASDLSNYLPLSGGQMTGGSITRNVDDDRIEIHAGLAWTHGACLALTGKDYQSVYDDGYGAFALTAINGITGSKLLGKPDGTLTWRDKNLDVIEEQGNGYIRYTNGIQICWGSISWTSNCTNPWGSLFETSGKNASYAKSFTELPSVSAYGGIAADGYGDQTYGDSQFGGAACMGTMLEYAEGTSATTPVFYLTRGASVTEERNCFVRYLAIGRWK